jgi:hypothetical protein
MCASPELLPNPSSALLLKKLLRPWFLVFSQNGPLSSRDRRGRNVGLRKKAWNPGMWLGCLCLIGASVSAQTAEQAAPKLTREQLVQSAKVYFRDSAEFPLTQRTTFSVLDSAGRIRKVKKQSLNYVFNGYNPGKKTASGRARGNVSFWSGLRGAKAVKAAMNSMLWTMIPGVLLYSDAGDYTFEAQGPRDELITARLVPVKRCPAFSMEKNPDTYFPDYACGPGEFQLRDDLSFYKFAFDASGLPVSMKVGPLGKSTLQRYHVEVEFQRVMLPGDKEPFLVPKEVTATLETDKGKLVISSVYEAKKT